VTRLILPAVSTDATPQQRAAQGGQGCLDELDQWERWLRAIAAEHDAAEASALADYVAVARAGLYLRAKAVIEGGAVQAWREEETRALKPAKCEYCIDGKRAWRDGILYDCPWCVSKSKALAEDGGE
jgi:hypothetical protein